MQAVILAAGESSRFWPLNYQHKSLIKVMGKPLIWYTISALRKAKVKDIIVVQDRQKQIEKQMKTYSLGRKIRYIVQPAPRGMGNAIFLAKPLIKDQFFVLDSYHFIIGALLEKMARKSKKTGAKIILSARSTDTPWKYGILKIKDDRALVLDEKPRSGKELSSVMVVGIYLLSPEFFQYYARVKKGKYALESALDLYMKEKDVRMVFVRQETPSLKYPWDLLGLSKLLMGSFLKGKTDKSAQISKKAVIGNNVYIGKGVKVCEGAVVKDFCYIGDNCIIGNNALIRDYSDLEDGVVVGANAEVARSVFQEGTHIHSGFFGDSILGDHCRVGADATTANVRIDRQEIKSFVKGEKIGTGLKSLGAVLGRKACLGIKTGIMPGILIGSNAVVGPGSIIFENVPDNAKVITKFQTQILRSQKT